MHIYTSTQKVKNRFSTPNVGFLIYDTFKFLRATRKNLFCYSIIKTISISQSPSYSTKMSNFPNADTPGYTYKFTTMAKEQLDTQQRCATSQDHGTFQNECYVGGTWITFEHITGIKLDHQCRMVFLLKWGKEAHFDTVPSITVSQLEFYPEALDWIQRFNSWSQTQNPTTEEVYTWYDLTIHVKLEPELLTWLDKHGLKQFVEIFTKKQCLSMASLSHLTDDLLQQWGISSFLRRYTLEQIQSI